MLFVRKCMLVPGVLPVTSMATNSMAEELVRVFRADINCPSGF
ncbi:hypothetical protein [Dryocola clanedunensis]|nr:hypothetical protein [Cedecea sulfonylureivorans]